MGRRKFVIGDVHGCKRTLQKLVEEELALEVGDTLYLLGDYVDRGPDSKGVIDYVISLSSQFDVRPLRGNHEQLMIDSVSDPRALEIWLKNGGDETLNSFGVESVCDIPKIYFDFIHSLEYFYEEENCFLVHAGFNFQKMYEDKEAMLWLRNFEVDLSQTGGKKVVHGHTIMPIKRIISNIKAGHERICLDAGCVFGYHGSIFYGQLAALNLDSWEVTYVDRID